MLQIISYHWLKKINDHYLPKDIHVSYYTFVGNFGKAGLQLDIIWKRFICVDGCRYHLKPDQTFRICKNYWTDIQKLYFDEEEYKKLIEEIDYKLKELAKTLDPVGNEGLTPDML